MPERNPVPHQRPPGQAQSSAALHTSATLHPPDDPGRAEVESFIAGVYHQRFGARVERFTPMLVALRDEDRIVAAAGWRDAGAGPLFLEQYLEQPVEQALAPYAGGCVPPRSFIVEVGHLAAAQAGEGRRLIAQLADCLSAHGYQWVVSTLTEELRRMFLRMGIAPLSLALANPAALGDAAAQWGSYYEHRPVVLAGQLSQAMRQLRGRKAQLA